VPGAAAAAKQGTNEWMTVPTRKAQLHGSGSTPGGGKGIGHDTGLGGPGEGDADGEKHPLWTFLKRAQDKAVRVGQCRSALGAIVAARNRPGEAGDAATTLGDVLTALEESLSPFAGDSDSPVADTFQLRMRCVSCGEQAEQPSFVHTVSAAVLRRAASPARGQGPEAMMRQACVAPEPPCPNCSRGSRRVLDAPPPPILALAIRWDAPASSSQETRAVLARLPRCMDLAAVLDSDAPGSALYRLRAMVPAPLPPRGTARNALTHSRGTCCVCAVVLQRGALRPGGVQRAGPAVRALRRLEGAAARRPRLSLRSMVRPRGQVHQRAPSATHGILRAFVGSWLRGRLWGLGAWQRHTLSCGQGTSGSMPSRVAARGLPCSVSITRLAVTLHPKLILQLARLDQLLDDIQSPHELALGVKLWEGRPL
jgi:hypothetical protein